MPTRHFGIFFTQFPLLCTLFYLPFGREPFSILETSHIAGLHLSPSPVFLFNIMSLFLSHICSTYFYFDTFLSPLGVWIA